jgi:hypothetical protein
MEFIVESKTNSKTKKYLESLIPSLLTQLNLGRSRRLLHVILDKDLEEHGLTMDMTEVSGSYLVILRPDRNLTTVGMTLAHEMVHVKQMAHGTLKYGSRGSVFWRGKKFTKKVKYLDCPWELQAFSRQEILFRRALEE